MMKKLFSITALMLLAFMLNAQSPYWLDQATGFTTASRGIRWIHPVSSSLVWCVAYDGSGGTAEIRELTKTTNGGTNWAPIVIPTGQIPTTCGISTVAGIDANTAFIAVYPTSGTTQGVYKTTNGGANWANTTAGCFVNASSFLNNVGFWDANNGVAQGDAWGTSNIFEIYTTTNGGANWLKVPDANLPVGLSAEDGWTTAFYSATFGGNKCAWFGTNKGRIYRTTDGGFNWTVAASGWSDCAGSIAFTDANNGVAICNVGSGGYLGFSRTTNGGATWAPENYTGTVYKAGVSAVPGRLGWYVRTGSDPASTSEQGSQISFDYGISWTEIDNSVQHTAVSFFDRDNGWTGGFTVSATEGGISKFVPGSVGLDINSIANNELNVYPNPCTGKFSLINAENSFVNIYNAAGSLIYSGTVNNVKSFSIDLTNQAQGLYIIQVKNSNGVQTQKVSIN